MTTITVLPSVPYPYVYPFSSLTDAQSSQRAYETGGNQPWHLDASMTATSFADFLGYAMVDQAIGVREDASGAHVALGYHNEDGVAVAAATVRLARVGMATPRPGKWSATTSRAPSP